MRILVLAEQYPWPAVDGYRRRLDHIIKGLAKAGEVDVVALHRAGTPSPDVPVIPGVAATIAVATPPDAGLREWIGTWLRSRAPRRVLGPDWSGAIEAVAELRSEAQSPYDLVWFSHADSWFAMKDHVGSSARLVDFDNLENLALRLRRRVPPRFPPDSSLVERIRIMFRWAISRLFDAVDEQRWERLQRECAASVDRVVVCSQLDVERSGCENAVVVGNGAEKPAEVVTDRRVLRSGVPTMLFIGALDYEPNTEAIEWFTREVFPLIRKDVPDASARIVGRGREHVGWIDEVDGMELVGSVPGVESELLAADVSIVTITVGAGTRLKVVEALANHIPMVTTTIGCEGIDLVDGQHALIADDAESFARACVEQLLDGDLRKRLADEGARLFESAYDWNLIEDRLADLARNTAN